jgi:hypothetical protein
MGVQLVVEMSALFRWLGPDMRLKLASLMIIGDIRGNSYRMREHRALATRLIPTPAKAPSPRARRPSRQEAWPLPPG